MPRRVRAIGGIDKQSRHEGNSNKWGTEELKKKFTEIYAEREKDLSLYVVVCAFNSNIQKQAEAGRSRQISVNSILAWTM